MSTKSNTKMLYLSAFGILFVVLGHIAGRGAGMLTFDQFFGYYSFHMPLFLFISGYFYREKSEENPFLFLAKKAQKLLIPYFLCNLFFLLLQTFLRTFGFTIGERFSFYNLFFAPWLKLQPGTLAIPSWYLIALFISWVYYILCRKLFSFLIRNTVIRDVVLTWFFLLVGIGSVVVSTHLPVNETGVVYLRSAVMLFFIQLGYVYKNYWEKHDKLPSAVYFSVVIAVRYCLVAVSLWKGWNLSYGLYSLVDFGSTGILFYLSGITGIALWLRISSLLATHPRKSRLLLRIGDQTKEIMFFHLTGFFILNSLIYIALRLWPYNGEHAAQIINFDKDLFFSSVYYAPDVVGFPLLYLVFGVGFSLLIGMFVAWIKSVFLRRKKATGEQAQGVPIGSDNELQGKADPQ